jgi:hypothetical protein
VTSEDTALTIQADDLIANDVDMNGDELHITSVQEAEHGTVSLNADGSIVFTPEADYHGEATFTYTVSDDDGHSDTATVTLNVTSVDDAPVVEVVEAVMSDATVTTTADELPEGASVVSDSGDTTVVQGAIVHEGSCGTSVDQWTFTHNGGAITIDTLTESGANYIDIDGDGAKDHLDIMIRLYDSNGNLVAVNDDSQNGTDDGSTSNNCGHIQDSYLDLSNLPAGEYSLAVGAYHLSNSEVTNDHNNSNDTGAYQITFTGNTDIHSGSTVYSYDLDINTVLTDVDGGNSEASYSISVDNIPDGATLSQNGVNLTPNSDGEYEVNHGEGLQVVSSTELSDTQINSVSVEVTSINGTETTTVTDTVMDELTGDDMSNTLIGDDSDEYIDGGLGADTVLAGAGDDTIVFDEADVTIEGSTGEDALVMRDEISFDFASLSTDINNIETIDLTGGVEGGTTLENLDFSEVLAMTDDDNVLKIIGDDADSVGLSGGVSSDGANGSWQQSTEQTVEEGITYNTFTKDDATLMIEDDISVF